MGFLRDFFGGGSLVDIGGHLETLEYFQGLSGSVMGVWGSLEEYGGLLINLRGPLGAFRDF